MDDLVARFSGHHIHTQQRWYRRSAPASQPAEGTGVLEPQELPAESVAAPPPEPAPPTPSSAAPSPEPLAPAPALSPLAIRSAPKAADPATDALPEDARGWWVPTEDVEARAEPDATEEEPPQLKEPAQPERGTSSVDRGLEAAPQAPIHAPAAEPQVSESAQEPAPTEAAERPGVLALSASAAVSARPVQPVSGEDILPDSAAGWWAPSEDLDPNQGASQTEPSEFSEPPGAGAVAAPTQAPGEPPAQAPKEVAQVPKEAPKPKSEEVPAQAAEDVEEVVPSARVVSELPTEDPSPSRAELLSTLLSPRDPDSGRIELMPRDPEWVFCYWRTSPRQLTTAQALLPEGEGRLVVELIAQGELLRAKVDPSEGRYYVRVPTADTEYRAELRLIDGAQEIVLLASSERRVPPSTARREAQAEYLKLDAQREVLERGRARSTLESPKLWVPPRPPPAPPALGKPRYNLLPDAPRRRIPKATVEAPKAAAPAPEAPAEEPRWSVRLSGEPVTVEAETDWGEQAIWETVLEPAPIPLPPASPSTPKKVGALRTEQRVSGSRRWEVQVQTEVELPGAPLALGLGPEALALLTRSALQPERTAGSRPWLRSPEAGPRAEAPRVSGSRPWAEAARRELRVSASKAPARPARKLSFNQPAQARPRVSGSRPWAQAQPSSVADLARVSGSRPWPQPASLLARVSGSRPWAQTEQGPARVSGSRPWAQAARLLGAERPTAARVSGSRPWGHVQGEETATPVEALAAPHAPTPGQATLRVRVEGSRRWVEVLPAARPAASPARAPVQKAPAPVQPPPSFEVVQAEPAPPPPAPEPRLAPLAEPGEPPQPPTQAPLGDLVLVLHAHLPFVRHPEHEDFLEEDWLYEAITECYLPILDALHGWKEDGVGARLTMSLTPPLCEMLRDELLVGRYERHLRRLIALAEDEHARAEREDAEYAGPARLYRDRLNSLLDHFIHRYGRDLVGAFGRMQEAGVLEIITCGATHGFLPLLSAEPSLVRAQIKAGARSYRQHFGRNPPGIWLPECGYYPGVDELLAEEGICYFIVDTHGVLNAEPRPEKGSYAPIVCPSGVLAFPRDPECSRQVWSAEEGYPGDFRYREFYRDLGWDRRKEDLQGFLLPNGERKNTGLKFHRITGRGVELNKKEVYDRLAAMNAVDSHARDFVDNRGRQIDYWSEALQAPPVVVAPFDAELFGHWWFEGPEFLNRVVRTADLDQRTFRLSTPSDVIARRDAQLSVPAASSWGDRGHAEVWCNDKNDWVWPRLHEAGRKMNAAVLAHPNPTEGERRLLAQMGRELLLASASDWPFIITMDTMVPYAVKRIEEHIARFELLHGALNGGSVEEAWLGEVEARDNIFPYLNPADFR